MAFPTQPQSGKRSRPALLAVISVVPNTAVADTVASSRLTLVPPSEQIPPSSDLDHRCKWPLGLAVIHR